MQEDNLIAFLSNLCKRFDDDALEGRYEVARRTGLSEQYLYQVLSGKPMANGNKRSLGKNARARISKVFPDWMTPAPIGNGVEQPRVTYEPKPRHARKLVQRLCDLSERIDDEGLRGLIEVAQCFIKTHPARKPKAA